MAEIRNPNASLQGPGGNSGGGGDNRSLFLFMTLALMALLAFQYFKPATPVPAQQQATQQAAGTGLSPQSGAAAPIVAVPGGAPAVTATTEQTTVVENELYRITFTNRGAQVKSWILKRYKDSKGKPLDLVNQGAAKNFGYPLSLYTYDQGQTSELNQALYVPSQTGAVSAPAGISFRYSNGPLTVTKTFAFNESYVVDATVAVTRNGAPVRALLSWPSGLGDEEEALQYTKSLFAWSTDGKRDSTGANKTWFSPGVSGQGTLNGNYDYAGTLDLYFGAVFLPSAPSRATVVTFNNGIDVPVDAAQPQGKSFHANVLGSAIGDTSGVTHARLFAGPLQFDVLAGVHTFAADGTANGQDLKQLIQFGWLKIIAEPLFWLLKLVHGYVGNWGWAIVIVTIVFNLAMLPTRISMMKSSLKMARVAPKMDAIKRKYANLKATDPRRAEQNTETMELYKQEGINPYGSCLPMLVQMPLFFAYYRVLANVIELRQATWGWLPNLAAADPYHILPIVIIISMFLVQFISPAPGMDKSQRRMMAFMMPAVFGVSMWNFASGLALYWCTGNLLNLGIQLIMNQSSMGRELHAAAAKRSTKGQNKTIQGRR